MRPHLLLCLVFLVALSVATPAHAQRWTGALKAGGAITQFSGETLTSVDFDPRVGLVGGVTLGYDFGTGFAVLAEMIYIRKGAFSDSPPNGIPTRIRFDLTYLEVPLLAQYRFETSGYVHPKIFAGPMVAFLLDSRIDESIENRDFGVVVGAGVEVEVSDQRLSFEARASFGMADITKPVLDQRDPSLRNTGIVFLVGVVF